MSDLIDKQQAIDYFVTNVGFHDEDGYPIEDECELREIWTGYFDGIPSAQPEPCEDAVSRETLLKFFDGWMSVLDENCHNQSVSDLKIIKRDFANLPPVTPAQKELHWIPCSERLPEIDQNVLLSTTAAHVGTGKRLKPETIWQVTKSSGEKEWVYTPEDYTDDIDSLQKAEDCAFDVFDSNYDLYVEGGLSVSSLNYKDRFEGITAWMPLPEPYKGVTDGDD